ncbi:MAG: ubiquinone biosynthesis protein UbiB [Thiobacillus sp. 63-78]|uniref:ABC1 kinase family protein n=1 Tax=Thiobacillus sp. 63-78 TaxID=1895859 RepID=UPI0008684BC8|nr:AarF/UbiB family protein [Thiobacillus sp. 63-78]MBN8763686.1 phosphotransferase [Thiobacillus sp.]ODV13924.1 MAG: ubiquinone biosynthesis protein UbiB [Thiobacillus sp. SCN 64-317]MBN8767197.1 phosphotransferase [Thiobacillus sp.]MBN8772727.1 phosphotransferase [Thiobacillus sp.]OJZ16473.1 MAG: ubiquinone biosynthesis protein UbiB [Thiobacillus sp. 63-78]
MLRETISVVRDLPRLHEIASVMIRYGWGDLVRVLGISGVLERAGQVLHWHSATGEISQLDAPVRVRRALEELGPTFVKLGQVLATRVDMFPPHWIAEFEKLHSQVPAVPYNILHPDLVAAIGGEPGVVFAGFDSVPLAAASIAQVYRATLKDGTRVVVKMRRPGIEGVIQADLRIMEHAARLLESEVPDSRRYDPVRMVSQFRRSLNRELDLAKEARNIDQFARHFADDPLVQIPKVYWEFTNDRVNVQEEIIGLAGAAPDKLRDQGLDPKLLAARGADTVLRMVLEHGYFHADPHPGNVLFLPDNRIGMIDFGMVGMLTHSRRIQIVDMLHALIRKDEQALLQVLLDWSGESVRDEDRLAYDVAELLQNYDDLQLKDVKIGILLSDITAIMRDNDLVLPADLTLLFKALITLEGLGQQLDPEFHMVDHVTPFVEHIIQQRYTPQALLARGRKSVRETLEVVAGLPRDLRHLLRDIRRGRIRVDLDLKRLDQFGHQLDRASNRLTMGILTASLVVGSSIIMTVKGGPQLFGLPFFGLVGFLIAFFNSLWIIFSIWRSGKH